MIPYYIILGAFIHKYSSAALYCLMGKFTIQRENWENRNDPDLVQAFPTKWCVESDLTASNPPLPLRLKGSGMFAEIIQSRFRTIVTLKQSIIVK
jgi:hypothetical protein